MRPPASAPAAYQPLARLAPGDDPRRLRDALAAWVGSDAMRELAAASGWTWPTGPLPAVVAELCTRSENWNFRAELQASSSGTERQGLTDIRAVVAGRALDEELIARCAVQLGVVGVEAPDVGFSQMVVLAGTAAACLNRTREGDRRRRAAGADHVAVLASNRQMSRAEQAFAVEQGWGALDLESEAAAAATASVFELDRTPDDEAGHTWDGSGDEQQRRRSWSHRRWHREGMTVEVVVAPSADPEHRRTNTGDQLTFWADRAGLGEADDLLLVTTEHYVPYQQLEAVRALGIPRRCGITTVGVAWRPEPFRGAAYLQEIRSTLLSATALLQALDTIPDGRPTVR